MRIAIVSILSLFQLICFGQNPVNKSYSYADDNGPHIEKFNNGQTRVQFKKVNGNIDGEFLSYHKNGKPYDIVYFSNGKFNGTNYQFNKKGDSTIVETYRMDTLIFFKEIDYFKSGIIKRKLISLLSDSAHINQFPNAKTLIKLEYNIAKHLNDQVRIVDNTIYYKSGNVKVHQDGIVVKGKHTGNIIYYYENGQIKEKEYYLNGLLEGEKNFYDKKGTVSKKENYKEGKKLKY